MRVYFVIEIKLWNVNIIYWSQKKQHLRYYYRKMLVFECLNFNLSLTFKQDFMKKKNMSVHIRYILFMLLSGRFNTYLYHTCIVWTWTENTLKKMKLRSLRNNLDEKFNFLPTHMVFWYLQINGIPNTNPNVTNNRKFTHIRVSCMTFWQNQYNNWMRRLNRVGFICRYQFQLYIKSV